MPSPAPPTTSWGRWAPTYIRPDPVIAATASSTGRAQRGTRFGADEGEGGRDRHVTRDPTQVARDPFANMHIAEHALGTRPSCERLRRLRAEPGGGPRGEERSRQAPASRQQRDRGDGRDRRERPGLHDGADGNAEIGRWLRSRCGRSAPRTRAAAHPSPPGSCRGTGRCRLRIGGRDDGLENILTPLADPIQIDRLIGNVAIHERPRRTRHTRRRG